MSDEAPGGQRVLRIELPIDSAEDLRALRGALLAARASELSEIQRRAGRLNLGYGQDSTRASMTDEVANLRRRWEMLDRLIRVLDEAAARAR
ncbi:MAG TPA: hypothetical protein VK194_10555 [Candidatus Deferrimicrobium sp.]|nr:hypothetical protein [Candidatus Deferrimicrobium sp.]